MICPQCGREGDASQQACWYCGFITPSSSPGGISTDQPQNKRGGPAQQQGVTSQQLHSNNIPARPQQDSSPYFQSPEQQKKQQRASLKATHITTSPLSHNQSSERALAPLAQPAQITPVSEIAPTVSTISATPGSIASQEDVAFSPGALLKGGRYRLIKKQEEQRWTNDIYENHWAAQDLFQNSAPVIISELGLPGMKAATRQTHLRTGMRELFSIGTHAHTSTLNNVFREGGRDFFVFEAVDGETLASLMKRNRQTLPEQDVIECCLQILNALEAMAAQTPPLVHGLINPDHLILARTGNWFLTDFSVVLASGAASYITSLDPATLSPFTAPEFAKGLINSSSDLYALLATAFFAITGSTQRGQLATSRISSALGAIFQKGLHPIANQRYQQPSALRQDLQALRTSADSSFSLRGLDSNQNTLPPLTLPDSDRNTLPPLTLSSSDRNTLPPLTRPNSDQNTLPPLLSPDQIQRMPTTASTTRWEGIKSEPRLAPTQAAAQAYMQQKTPNPLSQALSSLSFPDDLEEPARNLLPRPEDLPPMQRGNDMLIALLWMVGIIFCLLILVLLK
jgi:serine/threonine protein kinase